MNEIVYARSPSPGEIEIVFAKDHKAEAHKLTELEIASLWGALSEAIRHNYMDKLSSSRKTGPRGLEANRQTDRNAARRMGNTYYEGMIWVPGLGYFKDKSQRRYGRA